MDKEKHKAVKIKLVTSAITTYLFLSILTMLIWIALDPPQPATALSFSLVGSGTWAIGGKEGGTTWTSSGSPNTWTVTNDSSAYENISIQVTGSTPTGWTSGCDQYGNPPSIAENVYVLKRTPSLVAVCSNRVTALASSLAPGATSNFGLQFTLPTSGGGNLQQTLTVALTVTRTCGGVVTGDTCWYTGTGNDCNSVCAAHGGCTTSTMTVQDTVDWCATCGETCTRTAELSNGNYTPWLADYGAGWGCYYRNSLTVNPFSCSEGAYGNARRGCPCNY